MSEEFPGYLKDRKKADYLDSGCTILNVHATGTYKGAFKLGQYTHLVGDSDAGKTWLALTTLAAAANNPKFDDYLLIYDNVESGINMDMVKYYGTKLASRIQAPSVNEEGEPQSSTTLESFYDHFDDYIKSGKPFIYVVDSLDQLASLASLAKYEEEKAARRKGKETSGTYGMEAAKSNKAFFRRCGDGLELTNSVLLAISQTIDNPNGTYAGKSVSGGHALKFSTRMQIWLKRVGILKKTVKGKEYGIGSEIQCAIKKNHLNGRYSRFNFKIYNAYGIDDTRECIEYLVATKHWSVVKQTIVAPEFEIEAGILKLIEHIEENNLTEDLQKLVEDVHNTIITETQKEFADRKRRFL